MNRPDEAENDGETAMNAITRAPDWEPDQSGVVLQNHRDGPGLLVLASPRRLLHINKRAIELMRQLMALDQGQSRETAANGLLPAPLFEVCAEVFQLIRDRTEMKDPRRFEIKRKVITSSHSVLIRGFGLPDHGDPGQARMVVLLEDRR
ncbi:MAG: hypothetical protein E6K69_07250 [Nitrospirae bacterium]|nr:MAG: hypothetical protein E6K69_07250 [Nitrospirota bacterium]